MMEAMDRETKAFCVRLVDHFTKAVRKAIEGKRRYATSVCDLDEIENTAWIKVWTTGHLPKRAPPFATDGTFIDLDQMTPDVRDHIEATLRTAVAQAASDFRRKRVRDLGSQIDESVEDSRSDGFAGMVLRYMDPAKAEQGIADLCDEVPIEPLVKTCLLKHVFSEMTFAQIENELANIHGGKPPTGLSSSGIGRKVKDALTAIEEYLEDHQIVYLDDSVTW